MATIYRLLAELCHSKIGLASPLRLALAIATVVMAVVFDFVFKSAYWYWAILLAIPLILKLSRNDEAIRLYALLGSQSGLSLDAIQFYGILNGWLVRGERKMPHIEFAESLLRRDPHAAERPLDFDKRAPIGVHYCRLKDIQRIEHDSDKGELAVVTQSDSIALNLGVARRREKLVEQIVAQGAWQKESLPSHRFAPNIASLLFFVVPLILYGGCTIATAAGWVQVANLPLVDWGQVQKARRKARAVLTVCAAFSSAFLFLHDNVPPLPRGAIGVVVIIVGLVLAYYSCVIKFNKVVWKVGK
jgi:hypothetical protein